MQVSSIKCLIFQKTFSWAQHKEQNFACNNFARNICSTHSFTRARKGVFFNTKYLPKHQGVHDLLHLQYLSDASFFRLFTQQLLPVDYPSTEYNKREERKKSQRLCFIVNFMVNHLNNSQTRRTCPFNIFSMSEECKLFSQDKAWKQATIRCRCWWR